MHWTEQPRIALDFESTGIDTRTARILQAAIVTHDPAGTLSEPDHIVYVDPGEPIPPESTAIHGITAETLVEKKAWRHATGIPFILNIVNGRATMREYPLVIFNCCYDWPLLMAECARVPGFDLTGLGTPYFLDPLVLDRHYDKYRRGSRRLVDVAQHYGVELNGAHDAAADARASLGVMSAMIERYPEIKAMSLREIQLKQVASYATWRDGINRHWKKIGKTDQVTASWPFGEA